MFWVPILDDLVSRQGETVHRDSSYCTVCADLEAARKEGFVAALKQAISEFRDPDNPADCADVWGWHTKDYERVIRALMPAELDKQ